MHNLKTSLPRLLALVAMVVSLPTLSIGQAACDPAAEFNYDATTYCQNGTDPVLSHTTGTDGTYSYTVVSGGPTLVLDAATGAIDLAASDPGQYQVTNTVVTAGANCGVNGDLVLTGVFDGPLPGGLPKGVELYVINDIPDLSLYGLGSANNGGGSDGQEFTFPAVAVTAGTFIYVATESAQFQNWFGFPPDYTSNAMAINGDDAVELFFNGTVIDVFGDPNVDGTGEPWEYLDGWAYRNANTGPNGGTFDLANWTFSGPNALDGETSNATAATPFPTASYSCAGGATTATCTRTIEILAPPTAEAGFSQLTCGTDPVQLNASGTGTWSGGSGTFSDASDPMATYTPAVSEVGTAITLTWTISVAGSNCPTASDEVTITSLSPADAEFSYAQTSFCPNAPAATPSHTTGTDGVYSYTALSGGPNLALDPQTGQIDFAASDQGTYQITNTVSGCGNLVLTGVIDGPLSGGLPKAVELYALADIPDLSAYGLGSANNGNGSDGQEFTFPAEAVAAGTFLYVATETTGFQNFFGFAPNYTSDAVSINGDDAIELFCNGVVIDVFGQIDVDGTGQPWEYRDGWAYREPYPPSGAVFELPQWFFSGPDALDGETSNATAANPFPLGTFAPPFGGTCANASYSVTVSVEDTTPPTLTCPNDMTINLGPGACSAPVTFSLSANDDCDPNPTITQTDGTGLASGDYFPIGTHTLAFGAGDAWGNTSSCSFTVTVLEYPNPVTQLTCNNEVQISLDADGSVAIGADDLLEGGPYGCYDDYQVTLLDATGADLGTNVVDCSFIGTTWMAMVTDPDTGNKCWSQITVEDKLPPVFDCPAAPIPLNCSFDIGIVPAPPVSDNCAVATVEQTDQLYLDEDMCDDGMVLVVRSWVATDIYGNVSEQCLDTVKIVRPAPTFPTDQVWDCSQYADYPNIVEPTLYTGYLPTTGSGIPGNGQMDGTWCMYNYSHSDELTQSCGQTFKIVRTWTVLDWCTNAVFSHDQVIKVVDVTAPVVTATPVTVNADIPATPPALCRSTGFIPAPTVSDDCSEVTIRIFTPVGEVIYANGTDGSEGGYIPEPGLELGYHTITYVATDACGNTAADTTFVQVMDETAPVAVCDEITDVNLESEGLAEVFAETFDDGSHDNCCLDHFEVRRMDQDCTTGLPDDFGPSVTFCCDDAKSTVTVVFRAFDCFGNYNDCMVQVNVNDKITPALGNCPPPVTITCDQYLDQYAVPYELEGCSAFDAFGSPVFSDNCSFDVQHDCTVELDQCGAGTITRTWSATDASANTSQSCTQTITVVHQSDWVVEFPEDKFAVCQQNGNLPDFGEPEIINETCELIAVSYEDQVYTAVPDACYKIVRTWTVINWCVVGAEVDQETIEASELELNLDLDGDGDKDGRTFQDSRQVTGVVADTDPDPDNQDGFITYQQVIKVNDYTAPFLLNCADREFLDTVDCSPGYADLSVEILDDCSTSFGVSWDIDLYSDGSVDMQGTADGVGIGNFAQANGEYPYGTHTITYQVMDQCGNSTACSFTFTVRDGKKPTPYCQYGLVIELMPSTGMVDVWASDFDAGSWDNCPGELTFSFSDDTNFDHLTFTCDSVGMIPIELWVTDVAGNQDYCETFILVQDNQNACSFSNPGIAGLIATEYDEPVEGVMVELNGDMSTSMPTNAYGAYLFANVPAGGDYTVKPTLDEAPLNGVTTYDLVLITAHILNEDPLDSPYQLIAADANRSGAITTADLVELRKLILHTIPNFTNNTSWRFVDADYAFPDPANPWLEPFPEVFNVNNLDADVMDADFVAVKIGDVNGSAQTSSAFLGSEDRTTGTWVLNVADKAVKAGEEVAVTFEASDLNVPGFQFTIDFDKSALELVDVQEGVAKAENFGFALLYEGAITASWNGQASAKRLFTLKFRALKDGQLSDLLKVDSRFTKAEAYNQNGERLDVALTFHGQSTAADFALYPNRPNPFSDRTTISFSLPEATQATLIFTDLTGRVVKVIEGDYDRGFHQIVLSAHELPAGVLTCTLRTPARQAVRKMVVMKH